MTILDEVRAIQKQSAQRDLIAAALLKHGTISVTDAWNGVYGAKIRRLGARIWELRDEGWRGDESVLLMRQKRDKNLSPFVSH